MDRQTDGRTDRQAGTHMSRKLASSTFSSVRSHSCSRGLSFPNHNFLFVWKWRACQEPCHGFVCLFSASQVVNYWRYHRLLGEKDFVKYLERGLGQWLWHLAVARQLGRCTFGKSTFYFLLQFNPLLFKLLSNLKSQKISVPHCFVANNLL